MSCGAPRIATAIQGRSPISNVWAQDLDDELLLPISFNVALLGAALKLFHLAPNGGSRSSFAPETLWIVGS